jgi:hypothetical protein
MLEIVAIHKEVGGTGAYPGLYLFATPARMVRPVMHAGLGRTEWLGSLEQTYLLIAIHRRDALAGGSGAGACTGHTGTHTGTGRHTRTHTHMHWQAHRDSHTGTHTHTHTYTHTRTDGRTYAHTDTHTTTHACTDARM